MQAQKIGNVFLFLVFSAKLALEFAFVLHENIVSDPTNTMKYKG